MSRRRPTTVLVVEADERTSAFLAEQLGSDGFEVRVARTAQHARALARLDGICLVLLGDLEGPREGLEMLIAIRSGREPADTLAAGVPVIVLTRAPSPLDRLRAFEAGADDVVLKPFDYCELRARVRALLRRSAHGPLSRRVSVSGLEIDLAARCTRVDGQPVSLCRREYELLVHLAAEPSRVYTKDELLREVWGFQASGATRTLDSHACRLRRKLGRTGRVYVVNVWGVGYCLQPDQAQPVRDEPVGAAAPQSLVPAGGAAARLGVHDL